MDVAFGSQDLVAGGGRITGVLIQFYIVIVPLAVLIDTDPCVRGEGYNSTRGLSAINLDRQTGSFPDQHAQESCIAVTVATPVVHLAGGHVVYPAVLPDPAGVDMLVVTDVFHIVF